MRVSATVAATSGSSATPVAACSRCASGRGPTRAIRNTRGSRSSAAPGMSGGASARVSDDGLAVLRDARLPGLARDRAGEAAAQSPAAAERDRPRLAVEPGGHSPVDLERAGAHGRDGPAEGALGTGPERAASPRVDERRVAAPRRRVLRLGKAADLYGHSVDGELRALAVGKLGIVLAVVEAVDGHGDVRDRPVAGVSDADHEIGALRELLPLGERGPEELDREPALGLVGVLLLVAAARHCEQPGEGDHADYASPPRLQSGANIPPASGRGAGLLPAGGAMSVRIGFPRERCLVGNAVVSTGGATAVVRSAAD